LDKYENKAGKVNVGQGFGILTYFFRRGFRGFTLIFEASFVFLTQLFSMRASTKLTSSTTGY